MLLILVFMTGVAIVSSRRETNADTARGRQEASALQSGGNMEGKETRFGIMNTALWATVTTGTSAARSTDARLVHPLAASYHVDDAARRGGTVASAPHLWHPDVCHRRRLRGGPHGRPDARVLGKKIRGYEMKMASLVILTGPAIMLIGRHRRGHAGSRGLDEQPGPHASAKSSTPSPRARRITAAPLQG